MRFTDQYRRAVIAEIHARAPEIWDPQHPSFSQSGARTFAFAGVAYRLGHGADVLDIRRMWRKMTVSFYKYKARAVSRKPKFHSELSFLNGVPSDMLHHILIANDNVCRLFGLKDRSLIGKRFGDVFPVQGASANRAAPKTERQFDEFDRERGPLILDKSMFDEHGNLRPVYGKPVDILDADGNLSTVCVWSYPLTSAAAHATVPPRKSSAMLLRSPSAYMPSSMSPLPPIALNFGRT